MLHNEESEYGTIFVTQQNVEKYFEHVVVDKHMNDNSCMCIFQAFNFALNNIESKYTRNLVKIDFIQQQCKQQQKNYFEKCVTRNVAVDPHKGLKDVMSHEENLSIINTIYTNSRNSLDIAFSFLIGINAGVRAYSS
jgi:alpha-galactosidase/6-phospho-beta-glucosidase family protein